ncbi:MAG: AMP-binding protein, partial [Nitrospirales bacterium]|nr:AMP-binding protein [Nitrospirales bacterium]
MAIRETIPAAFRESAEKYKDLVAFGFFDGLWREMTYGELLSLSDSMAYFFLEAGLRKGQRVAIVVENRPEWAAAFMAIQTAGGIAVPIDMHLGSAEIRNLLLDSGAWGVCFTATTAETAQEAIEGRGIREVTIDSPFPKAAPLFPDVSPDETASIIYTSGTTGRPKGVVLTHRNLCADASAVMAAGIVSHRDNVLSVLPLHHTYPFMCTLLVPLLLGGTVTFAPALKAADLVSAIRERKVTAVVAVPRLLEMIRNGIMAKIGARPFSGLLLALVRLSGSLRRSLDVNLGKFLFSSMHRNFGRLRFFASGGARLDTSVMWEMEALGFTVLEGYGLTETSPVITFNLPEKRKPGSAGKPFPGVEIKTGEDGEVMVKGPMVFAGYYNNPAATEEAFRDGWFLTGDLGSLDADGYLFITGRKKEVIILSSGKTVYPEDVEKAYSSIRLIKEICVTGMERDGVVDALFGVIVPDMDYARHSLIGNIAEALKWEVSDISQDLPEYMRIKGFSLRAEPLPRTPLGKLRRFMVKAEMARPGEERLPDPSLAEDEVGRRVLDCLKSVMHETIPVHAADNLELDLGFDSLKRLEFLSSLEEAFSVSLPEQFISQVQTVGEAVEALKSHLSGGGSGGTGRATWADILSKEPDEADRAIISLSLRLLESLAAYTLYLVQKLVIMLFFRLETAGRENLPSSGPYIIAPNHTSYLDGFILASAVKSRIFEDLYFIGSQRFFTGGVFRSWFARMAHVIPIDPETYLQRALQISAFVLREGKVMCVFPEGGRSLDGSLMPFKKGIGILALELGIPVIPAYIEGAFDAL